MWEAWKSEEAARAGASRRSHGLLWHGEAVFAEEPSLTTPNTNHGKKWRIGYLEGGVFYSYGPYLQKVIKGLMELGWIEKAEIPAA